jgi:pimeloyl-[acyl-carrier protein] methyl ester esterase
MPALLLPHGAVVNADERGGGGPALLALHGWSTASEVLLPWLESALPDRRIVALDLRGHGRSPSAAPFSLEDLARDVAAAAQALHLATLDLLGWSLGGLAALSALPLLGSRVRRLVLVSSTPRFTAREPGWPHGVPPRALRAVAALTRRDPARAASRFWDGMFSGGERATAAPRPAGLPFPPGPDLLAGLDVLARADLRPELPALRLPTLVLHGEADPVCPHGAGRALAAAIGGARLEVLPGAGHVPFLTRPVPCARALADFLAPRDSP